SSDLCNDPPVAPTHDGVDPTNTRRGVAACCRPNAIVSSIRAQTQDQCACDRAMVRVRSPPGLNNARTSSRLGLDRSPGFSATRGSGTSLTFVSDRHLDLFQGICLVQSHDRIPCGSPMIMMRSKSMMNGEQAG